MQEKVVEIEQCNFQKNNSMCEIVIKKSFFILRPQSTFHLLQNM